MPEPRLEEVDNKPNSKGNPFSSLMGKKIKIFGREIPVPLIMLGALVLGVIIFSLIGKRKGGDNQISEEDAQSLGFSETPQTLGETAQNGANTSIDEMQSDLGGALPIEPLPLESFTTSQIPSFDVSPLPTPELPYSNLGNFGFQSDIPFLGNPDAWFNQPIQSPIQSPNIPSNNRSPNGLAREKITAIASETRAPIIRAPAKQASALPVKKAAKATGKPTVQQTSVRPPTIRVPPKTKKPTIPLPPKFQLPVRPPTPSKPKPPSRPPVVIPLPPKFQTPSRPNIVPKQTPKRTAIRIGKRNVR